MIKLQVFVKQVGKQIVIKVSQGIKIIRHYQILLTFSFSFAITFVFFTITFVITDYYSANFQTIVNPLLDFIQVVS